MERRAKISLITAEMSSLEEVGVSAGSSLATVSEDALAGPGSDDCLSELPEAGGHRGEEVRAIRGF